MWFTRLAKSLAVVAIAVACIVFGAGVYFVVTSGDSVKLIWDGLFSLFIAAAYAIVGMLVASRYPRNPIGWIFLTVSWLDILNLTLGVYRVYGPVIGGTGYIPAIFHDLWMPTTLLPTIFVFLLFPDGRLISQRWRIIFWLAVLGMAGTHFAVALHPGPLPSWGKETNPDGIPGLAGVLNIVLQFTQLFLLTGILGSLAAFVIRIRRAQGIERQQMKWLGYALGLMLLSIIFSSIAWLIWTGNTLMIQLSDLMTYLALLGIAAATSIAILRYRLYDIDVVINRTLVYGALTASIVLIYVLIVGGLGTFFQAQDNLLISLLATGLVAVLFQPLREWLQRRVNISFG